MPLDIPGLPEAMSYAQIAKLYPQELEPDDPPNWELERKRKKIDMIGAALGTLFGAGAGALNIHLQKLPQKWHAYQMLLHTAGGYGMGAAAARWYGAKKYPRQKEILSSMGKSAELKFDINNLYIPEKHKNLLAMSKAFLERKRMDVIDDQLAAKAGARGAMLPKKDKLSKKASALVVGQTLLRPTQ